MGVWAYFAFGLILGMLVCFLLKDKLMGTETLISNLKRKNEELVSENEKLNRRNKDLKRDIEDLGVSLEKNRREVKRSTEDYDDLEMQIDNLKNKLRKMNSENEMLKSQLSEYGLALENISVR